MKYRPELYLTILLSLLSIIQLRSQDFSSITSPLSLSNSEASIAQNKSIENHLFWQTKTSEDTVQALHNLFHRKSVGGIVRASIFGVLAITALVNTVNYKPTTVTVNQGSSGSQTIPIDDSPPAGNYIGIGLFSILSITGITQASYYSNKNLDSIIENWKNGKPLPERVKKKLKKKDFKASH